MASADAEENPNKLVYTEKDYTTFDLLLRARLVRKDRKNSKYLPNKYDEAKLPDDPLRKLIKTDTLTADKLAQLKAHIGGADYRFPTKMQILLEPEKYHDELDEKIASAETSIVTTALKKKYVKDCDEHMKFETEMYKTICETLHKAPHLVKKAPSCAGRALLYHIRQKNKLNATIENTTTLLKRFWKYNILPKETITKYKSRLDTLVDMLETAEPEPQPISSLLQFRIYIQGLRIHQGYSATLDKIRDLDEQTLDYVHDKILDAEGLTTARIHLIWKPTHM